MPPLTGWSPLSASLTLRFGPSELYMRATLTYRLLARPACSPVSPLSVTAAAAAAFAAGWLLPRNACSLRCATRIDGICYYIWTDIFFGDMSNGRMNQFVPQLILGNALDGSSGAPAYKPKWGEHKSYSFGNTTYPAAPCMRMPWPSTRGLSTARLLSV